MSSVERTKELWLEIDQRHLKYLQHDDNVAKIELRKELEQKVKEYLCLVPQDRKFVSPTTGDIISNSIRWINEFSLSKAAEAFQCIEQYAANLINQPWRQEYRTIRQYNGFYTHNIKSALSGAENLFLSMGYIRDPSDADVFKLPTNRSDTPVDLDAVTKVARDCLLARMEAIILQMIHIGVASQFALGLDELMEFRRDHIGSPEDAIRELLYRKNQSRFQFPGQNLAYNGGPQVYAPYMAQMPYAPYAAAGGPSAVNSFQGLPNPQSPPQTTTFPGVAPTNSFQSLTNGNNNNNKMFNPSNNGAFIPVASPTTLPMPLQHGAVATAGGSFNNNPYQMGYHMASFPINGQVNSGASPALINGFPLPPAQQANLGMLPVGLAPAAGQVLPTTATVASMPLPGSAAGHSHSPAGSSTSTLRQGQIPTTILDLADDSRRGNENGVRTMERPERGNKVRNSSSDQTTAADRNNSGGGGSSSRPSRGGRNNGRTRNSGGDEIESWDFVYKELEQQGYNKDNAKRPDILGSNHRTSHNDDQTDEELRKTMSRMHLSDRDRPPRGGREKGRHRDSREFPAINTKDVTSESEQETSRYSSANSKNTERDYRTPTQERPQRANRGHGHQPQQSSLKSRKSDNSGMWECRACTFHNSTNNNICEMCNKTRENSFTTADEDTVDFSKRQETKKFEQCSRCTLENPANAKVCEACGTTLGLAPLI